MKQDNKQLQAQAVKQTVVVKIGEAEKKKKRKTRRKKKQSTKPSLFTPTPLDILRSVPSYSIQNIMPPPPQSSMIEDYLKLKDTLDKIQFIQRTKADQIPEIAVTEPLAGYPEYLLV